MLTCFVMSSFVSMLALAKTSYFVPIKNGTAL